jgi:hypothetical protein
MRIFGPSRDGPRLFGMARANDLAKLAISGRIAGSHFKGDAAVVSGE